LHKAIGAADGHHGDGSSDIIQFVFVTNSLRAFARHMPDQTIASVLNRLGKSTSHGHSWTRGSVCSLRHQNDVAIHRLGERAERGEATINEAAVILDISTPPCVV
jgi:hypothetical protein